MGMIEGLKFMVGIVLAMFESMPQSFTEADGTKTKIPDDNYYTLITDGVVAMATGAGFSIVGLTDAQLRGALRGFLPVVRAWSTAPRVVVA